METILKKERKRERGEKEIKEKERGREKERNTVERKSNDSERPPLPILRFSNLGATLCALTNASEDGI